MERAWTVSIIGIIVALGGLGFIAIFFAVVGYFFKKTDGKKKNRPTVQNSPTTLKRSASAPLEKRTDVVSSENEEETVAAMAAALAAFGSSNARVISVKQTKQENARVSAWRFHESQKVWRTLKRK